MAAQQHLDPEENHVTGELVFALVAAVGTDVEAVAQELKTKLRTYEYGASVVRLSDFLRAHSELSIDELPLDERLAAAMTLGDNLRGRWRRNDALALHAVRVIATERDELATAIVEPQMESEGLARHAWILRSLKTPEELRTLRAIYGPRLICISAYSPRNARVDSLHERIRDSRNEDDPETWQFTAKKLIERDEHDEERHTGQDLSGTFHQADFFVRADRRSDINDGVARGLSLLFGDPFLTPTMDEQGQFLAKAAGVRSAELGRQVGAAVTDIAGSTLAVGCNEVPKFGGGSHWVGDPDDNRDFATRGRDTNREHLDGLADRLASAVAEHVGEPGLSEELPAVLRANGLKDLTEFGRAVHAEMSAILDAARRGVSIFGATLHTTTFPCHNCARHIIGAGIARVVYVEPYPKSKALDLHDDSIVVDELVDDTKRDADSLWPGPVRFEPFVGVAPRWFLQAFDSAQRSQMGHTPRKDGSGRARAFEPKAALPIGIDVVGAHPHPLLPGYRSRELLAIADLSDLIDDLRTTPLSVVPSDAN